MKWKLSQNPNYPFDYQITDEEGTVILEQRPYAYGTKQVTLADWKCAKGFSFEEKVGVIEGNEKQRKNLERMASNPNPTQQYEHLTVATEKLPGEYWMDGITRLVKQYELQGWQVASMVDTSFIIFKRPTVA